MKKIVLTPNQQPDDFHEFLMLLVSTAAFLLFAYWLNAHGLYWTNNTFRY